MLQFVLSFFEFQLASQARGIPAEELEIPTGGHRETLLSIVPCCHRHPSPHSQVRLACADAATSALLSLPVRVQSCKDSMALSTAPLLSSGFQGQVSSGKSSAEHILFSTEDGRLSCGSSAPPAVLCHRGRCSLRPGSGR